MARMIPSFADERTVPGERDVFNMLAAGPDDWTALHALDLAPWNRGLRTEIDFVVIDPETGILCIEIKSHDQLSFDGVRWYPESINRSPFKQASDGRHTFYRRLAELAPPLRRIPVVHCCIFPRAAFDLAPNLSVQPWELMDGRSFRLHSSGSAFCVDLRERIVQSISADHNLNALDHRLPIAEVEQIVRCCVPIQKRHPDRRQEISRREHEMDHVLRQQQKPLVRLSALNSRIVVSGGAGTGKTLIAMEAARRAAESGRRVALLCFNKLVGEWMKKQVQALGPPLPNLIVGRAIRILAEMANVEVPPTPGATFWDVELPQRLEERLTDPEFRDAATIDYLVLDEAQDVLARPWLWDCIEHFLAGGLADGAFALLGDFENQVLVDRAATRATLETICKTSRATRWKLSENCRNYRIIGDTAVSLAGINDVVYEGYLRLGGSIENYNILFYEDDTEQLAQIGQILKHFKSLGYRPAEIVLLSLRTDEMSAAARLKQAGYRFRPAWQEGESTSYASIHSYKGMESKVVILTDMLLHDKDFHRSLFYTGMTRATESVRVLCDRRSQDTLRQWLEGRSFE